MHTLTDATEKILKLRGVDYILNKDSTKERQIGFIAQEVDNFKTTENNTRSIASVNLKIKKVRRRKRC